MHPGSDSQRASGLLTPPAACWLELELKRQLQSSCIPTLELLRPTLHSRQNVPKVVDIRYGSRPLWNCICGASELVKLASSRSWLQLAPG